MPRFDQTGPTGRGPATGRGLGVCIDNQPTGFVGGFGRGRRCERGGNAPVSLKEEENFLKQRLKDIQKAKAKDSKSN